MMLSSGSPQFRLSALFLLSIVSSLIAFRLSFSGQASSRPRTDSISSPALRALSKFLIPTSSIWPKTYLSIAHSAEQFPGRSIVHINLELIFREIRQGIIELRNPSGDLPRLVKRQLQLNGWNFKLDISWKNKVKIWTWAISDELSFFPEEAIPKLCTFADEGNISPVERTVLNRYCSLFFEKHGDIVIWSSLDAVPRAFTQTFIRSTQAKLKRKHEYEKTSVFSFTTSEAGFSIFDDAFIFAALPFSRVFSKYLSSESDSKLKQPGRLPGLRCSTPLFTRLPEILSLLTSGPNALHVLSLSNGSASYASALEAHASALEYDEAARRECIKDVGIQGWREERMYARWEAALLTAGLLARWVVLLESRD
ncbi:hypothetical protein A7U60_g6177 [Sanghuangporus baumii]|uniref:Uncharacterized protein n=1 Tax=Sanghuangporus baumii TaxID=108892 RepID=A0A9Q5N7I8_SANBA|nr:hypothetical protein A7U60_g6177 [Sanghuangporus baumii]